MKQLKYIALGLFLLAAFDGSAKVKRNKKKQKAQVVKVDTCSVDTFSYAMGMANTQGLQNYLQSRMGVDQAHMKSFIEGFNASMSEEERLKLKAYSAGLEIREQVKNQIIPGLNKQITDNDSTKFLNEALFIQAFTQVLAGEKTNMTMPVADSLAQKNMKYYKERNMELKYGANRREGEAFLKANAKKDSVQTLPSGVQYKVLVQGTGEMPKADSKVKVHYEGKLIDGTVFDSSYKRKEPTTFGCNQVIKGWTEALTHMPVGSTWMIYIPQELGYGAREAGKIPPFSTLIFKVELLSIEK